MAPEDWLLRKPSLFRTKRMSPPPAPSSGASDLNGQATLRKRDSSLQSLTLPVSELTATLRRSTSLRSYRGSHRSKTPSSSTLVHPSSPEKRSASSQSIRPEFSTSGGGRRSSASINRHEERTEPLATSNAGPKTPMIAVAQTTSSTVAPSKREEYPRPPTSHSHVSSSTTLVNGSLGLPTPLPAVPSVHVQSPNAIHSHIYEVASKRIATFEFLRKAPQARDLWWFQTLRFNKSDVSKLPYFNPQKLARRASNFLLLGLSLPTVLDLNSSNATEYLRALNTLLVEFEAYQNVRPPEGTTSSSLSRNRIPQLFKRAASHAASHANNGVGKGRRTSATESNLPSEPQTSLPSSSTQFASGNTSLSSSSFTVPTSDHDLLPGEEYTHLLTPSLPFDPDFYETFVTLCDNLIDVYTRLLGLIYSPDVVSKPDVVGGGNIGELFASADKKIRKLVVQGITKDFEEKTKEGVRSEMAGVGRLVLGGLM